MGPLDRWSIFKMECDTQAKLKGTSTKTLDLSPQEPIRPKTRCGEFSQKYQQIQRENKTFHWKGNPPPTFWRLWEMTLSNPPSWIVGIKLKPFRIDPNQRQTGNPYKPPPESPPLTTHIGGKTGLQGTANCTSYDQDVSMTFISMPQ